MRTFRSLTICCSVFPQGVSGPGGVCSGGVLPARGVLPAQEGFSLPGEFSPPGDPPITPLWTESHTRVKT